MLKMKAITITPKSHFGNFIIDFETCCFLLTEATVKHFGEFPEKQA